LQLDGLWRHLSSLDPWFSLGLFISCSMLMVFRLNALERKGLEGTVLGTLVMPYASGFPNLMFAFSLGRQGGSGSIIVENCIVNNVTNLTLLIGLPALIWTLNIFPVPIDPGRPPAGVQTSAPQHPVADADPGGPVFFQRRPVGPGRDGVLDFGDGLVLVGIFLFWQVLHVFDVLKYNIHQRRSCPGPSWSIQYLVVAFWVPVCSPASTAWWPG
jgi:cation:H+ antiporter